MLKSNKINIMYTQQSNTQHIVPYMLDKYAFIQ
nr:MAG TPA_asm: hypothetical protein [Bacteriophage sp.]